MNILKQPHGAGGYTLKLTEQKGNTHFGDAKKKVIIEALRASDTEGVYITTKNEVVRQLLNGTKQKL